MNRPRPKVWVFCCPNKSKRTSEISTPTVSAFARIIIWIYKIMNHLVLFENFWGSMEGYEVIGIYDISDFDSFVKKVREIETHEGISIEWDPYHNRRWYDTYLQSSTSNKSNHFIIFKLPGKFNYILALTTNKFEFLNCVDKSNNPGKDNKQIKLNLIDKMRGLEFFRVK